jgi:hypothetical protein
MGFRDLDFRALDGRNVDRCDVDSNARDMDGGSLEHVQHEVGTRPS